MQPLHLDPPVVPPMEAVSVAQPTNTRPLNIWYKQVLVNSKNSILVYCRLFKTKCYTGPFKFDMQANAMTLHITSVTTLDSVTIPVMHFILVVP